MHGDQVHQGSAVLCHSEGPDTFRSNMQCCLQPEIRPGAGRQMACNDALHVGVLRLSEARSLDSCAIGSTSQLFSATTAAHQEVPNIGLCVKDELEVMDRDLPQPADGQCSAAGKASLYKFAIATGCMQRYLHGVKQLQGPAALPLTYELQFASLTPVPLDS